MAVSFQLEDFGTRILSDDPTIVNETSLEEHRLEAFEQGYKAGWDDAAAAQKDDQSRISTDFAQNLNDLSFSYHEARTQILSVLEPLLTAMVSKVLPHIAAQDFPHAVVRAAMEVAANRTEADLEIVVAPANRAALEGLLESDMPLNAAVVEEPSLGEGQAYLRFAAEEKEIDTDKVLSGLAETVSDFFCEQTEAVSHG